MSRETVNDLFDTLPPDFQIAGVAEVKMAARYYVRALWDAEAEVWVSESDIPGLVVEAESLPEFEALVQSLAPEMLAENLGLHGATVGYDFTASTRRELRVA